MSENISRHQQAVDVIRDIYGQAHVPLHRPVFEGNERQYLVDCIDSNFVSSVGVKVTELEQRVATFIGARHAIATVNGTAALHVALQVAGVQRDEEVITQALSFIATCAGITYVGAHPVFLDVDRDTLGLSPEALKRFLAHHAEQRDGGVYNKSTGRRIAACVPMHTFGHPCRIDDIVSVCQDFGITVIEDAAESLGSYVGSRHTGTMGLLSTFSFNGNKVITTGGGGMVATDDSELAAKLKHITTTAKLPHPYEFVHDEVGYNYRMPNLNAALGCAQMERLPEMLAVKAQVAARYAQAFESMGLRLVSAPVGTTSNHWLNALLFDSVDERNEFLAFTNGQGVMTRPIWRLMTELQMFSHCQHDDLVHSRWLEARTVNIPSSVPEGSLSSFQPAA